MNGYKIISEGYRKASAEGLISQEEADKMTRLYDFIATLDQEDLFNLFDSSICNEIAMSYVRAAVKELISEGVLGEDQAKAVRNRVSFLFDEKQAREVF